ncbi:MAG: glycoside hydrolase family 95 protein [Bacteroides sp.]|nr:glycoside hydrolase family 95 protein [Bacteroides sp.]
MKRIVLRIIAMGCALMACPDVSAGEELMLWYRQPAHNWVTEALPIGNGDMGAMIFGDPVADHIQFNEKTLWRGSDGANDLGTYLNFGDLYITFTDSLDEKSDYIRRLDLSQALATVDYTTAAGGYSHEYFASNPDGVIAIRYTAPGGYGRTAEIRLSSGQGAATAYSPAGNASFSGQLDNGMKYHCGAMVLAPDGQIEASDRGLTVNGAEDIIIFLSCATDFDPLQAGHLSGKDPSAGVNRRLHSAVSKGYERVKADHIADHSRLFSRVDFALSGARNDLPTDSLLRSDSAAHRAMTDMLIFQYGRYLTIASSRGGAVPSNLQGIWNKDGSATKSAVWASDIHSNINVQMNYWPVESANLSECHMPLLNYLRNEALRPGGAWQRNAADLGADEGWVVNTAGNIFGGSSAYKAGKYSVAGAWLCDHLWQHYVYTLDRAFLREHAWPLMQSAARFWLKRLVRADDGSLECPNEYSPEQGHIQNATAHSQQIVTMLFSNTLAAIDSLGLTENQALRDSVSTALEHLDRGLRVDFCGLLREWKYQANTPNLPADTLYWANDEANVWQGHRHLSHLIGLYPGFLISPDGDQELFNAARATLNDRGLTSTGWGRAWRIALRARTRDGKAAYEALRGFAHPTRSLKYDWHGGLYDNLLDAHATSVFQIDGNFGATAAIAEMLLFSGPDGMIALPALPSEWPDGHIRGLKARGNIEVNITWADGKLTSMETIRQK